MNRPPLTGLLERALRNVLVRTPLAESRLVGGAYARLNALRFRNAWDRPLAFRGAQFCVGRDLSLYPFVRSGGFEEREFDWLLPRVGAEAHCWDVGANIGIYSVLLAKTASRGSVVAFEPVPDTVGRLRHNIGLNGVGNVRIEEVALGDEQGTARVGLRADQPGGNRLDAAGTGPEVRVTTADAYWRATGVAPDVVKVDIEGHEPEFVRGAATLLAEVRPLLLTEVNGATFRDEPHRREAWQEMLDSLFGTYGSGLWFGVARPEVVRHLDVALVPPRPCSLVFGALG